MTKPLSIYRSFLFAFALAVALCLVAGVSLQSARAFVPASLTVRSSADSGGTCPGPSCTLRQAIAAAAPGDTIGFDLSTVTSPIVLASELAIDKSLTIQGPGADLLTVSGNHSVRVFNVGGVDPGIEVTISGLTIADGRDLRQGGGVLNRANMLNLTGVLVTGNVSGGGSVVACDGAGTTECFEFAGFGGGIANGGTLNLTDSTVSNNTAGDTHYESAPGTTTYVTLGCGGGILNSGTLNMTNSTVSGNVANRGTVTSTSLNVVVISDASRGGGILNGGTLTIASSTIAANSAGNDTDDTGTGGGIENSFFGGAVSAKNTILARNAAATGPDFAGPLTSQGFNLIGNNSGAIISPPQATDQVGTSAAPIDPLLNPLAGNCGHTPTMSLRPGSPAIDKGNSFGLTADQRGALRPVDNPAVANATGGDGADVGAFEVQNSAPAVAPLSQGYWKNHPEAWPVGSLTLGGKSYTQVELLKVLNTPAGTGRNTDASVILAYQLIAAKLNVANGANAGPVSSAIAQADGLLSVYPAKLPLGVKTSTAAGQAMVGVAGVLESYNSGLLTPPCTP